MMQMGTDSHERRFLAAMPCLLIMLVLLSLLAGRVWLSPSEIFSGNGLSSLIVMQLRLPRTVLALLAGGALGLSGAALQGLTRNPLAEPGLLGISSGASLGAVIAIYFGFSALMPFAVPGFGLFGALAAMSLTFALGRGGGILSLVLSGLAVNGLMAALISLALNFAPSIEAAYEIMTWLMGSLSNRSWEHVLLAAPFVILGSGLLFASGRALDALTLGEVQAASLGIGIPRTRLLVLAGTAFATGAATSIMGSVGFVGLVSPHLVRPFFGYSPKRTLVPSALMGAALMLTADIATRLTAFGPEMNLGVFTALLGSPFFFWLAMRMRKSAP